MEEGGWVFVRRFKGMDMDAMISYLLFLHGRQYEGQKHIL
jgi:hypothetical protein